MKLDAVKGLSTDELTRLIFVFDQFKEIEKVLLFGSRAMGNFKRGSDVDLALFGDIDKEVLFHIKEALDEDPLLPYFFDLVVYDEIESLDFKTHIDSYGKLIYFSTQLHA